MTRTTDRSDIIQISLVDTAAASAAGAYVLTEHSLYTVEAWKLFLSKLRPGGILSVSRWHLPESPFELYRLVSLASASLIAAGVENPLHHVALLSNKDIGAGHESGIGTILVSNEPLSDRDISSLEALSEEMGFSVIQSPRSSLDSTFQKLLSREGGSAAQREFPVDISPPTDDKPFFFYLLRLRNIFDRDLLNSGAIDANGKAVGMLYSSLFIAVFLVYFLIVAPLRRNRGNVVRVRFWPFVWFFSLIGLAFMLIEMALIQRFNIYLGHPAYSLIVVLFTLLLASGCGSYLSQRLGLGDVKRPLVLLVGLLLAVTSVGIVMPKLLATHDAASMSLRILVVMALLIPVGIPMGMAFPVGMRAARREFEIAMPIFWGINGAFSVCASILAVIISLSYGVAFTYWTGVACYAAAAFAFWMSVRK